MKFRLETVSDFYKKEKVSELEKLGFKFINSKWKCCGKTTVRKLDEDDGVWPIFSDIDTLEELMDFIGKYGQIVLDKNNIIIYDGYL